MNGVAELFIHLAHLPAVGDNRFSDGVKDHALSGPDQKLRTKFLLDAADPLRKSRLGQKVLVGNFCDVFRLIEIDQKLIVLFIHKAVTSLKYDTGLVYTESLLYLQFAPVCVKQVQRLQGLLSNEPEFMNPERQKLKNVGRRMFEFVVSVLISSKLVI